MIVNFDNVGGKSGYLRIFKKYNWIVNKFRKMKCHENDKFVHQYNFLQKLKININLL